MKQSFLLTFFALITCACGLVPPTADEKKGVVHGQVGAISTKIVEVNGQPNAQHYIFGVMPGRYRLGVQCSHDVQFAPSAFGSEEVVVDVKPGIHYELLSLPSGGRCNVKINERTGKW